MKLSKKTLLRITAIIAIAILTAAFLSACGGGGQEDEGGDLPIVQALPQDRPEMSVERDGVIPCGLTEVTQWGYHTLRAKDFSVCENYFPSLTVAGRHRVESRANISRELVKDFFIALDLYYAFDSKPLSESEQTNDFSISTSLGWSF